MKKKLALILGFSILAYAGSLQADDTLSPEAARDARRAELKEIKARMRKERGQKQPSKFQEFMKREGKRSGVSEWGKGTKNWVSNLNPVPFFKEQDKRYEERKAAGR